MKKVWVAKTTVSLILTLAVLLSFTVIANATREQNIGETSEPAVARVSDSKIDSVDAVRG